MRDHHIDLCGQIDFTRTEAMPLLARDAHFSFACNGCGDYPRLWVSLSPYKDNLMGEKCPRIWGKNYQVGRK